MKRPPSPRCETCLSRGKSVFCDLSEEHLRELDAAKTTNLYHSRQIIFYEGNQPMGLHCIASGKIKIYKTDNEGHQQIVRLVGSGDIIGYRSLLSGELYSATAETLEDAQICFIDKKTFFNLLATHPATALHVMARLSGDLGSAEKQMLNLAHKNIRERLSELFLIFGKKYGERQTRGILLNISLSREELAELIGTTQESVIRLISEFKQDGLIAVEGRQITLLDVNGLMKTANLAD